MDAWHIEKSSRFWSNAKGTKDEVALKQLVVCGSSTVRAVNKSERTNEVEVWTRTTKAT